MAKKRFYTETYNGHEYTFDIERAYDILKVGIKAREERRGVFAYDFLYPEATLPPFIEPGSKDNAMYWFLSTFWDYGIGSARFYKDFYFYISYFPQHLDARVLRARGWWNNRKHFKKYISHPNAKPGAKYLDSALDILIEKYDGDPTNIVNDIDDINEARKRLIEFKNFREKKANLLLLYYTRYGITSFENLGHHQVAVDTHKVRVPANLGIFNVTPEEEVKEKFCIEFMNRAYQELIRQHPDLDVSKVDDVFWVIGARLCNEELLLEEHPKYKDKSRSRKPNSKWFRCIKDCPIEPFCERVIYTDYGVSFDFSIDLKPNFNEILFSSGSLPMARHEDVKGRTYDTFTFEPRVMPYRFPKRKFREIIETDAIHLRPAYETVGAEGGRIVRVQLPKQNVDMLYARLAEKNKRQKKEE
ncbi:MAG: hypothetical protein KAT43_05425 [Nanoarchaeota archaeon]|nr:hypothetical protein [Nanoarchaeota archaeon]